MHTVPVSAGVVPPVVSQLSNFLTRMSSMGSEVGFWRAKTKSAELERFTEQLLHLSHHSTYFQDLGNQTTEAIRAFEQLHAKVKLMVNLVPFTTRVNLIHRSLIPCYQQIFVLENLVVSILCRLRHRANLEGGGHLQPGSLLDVEARREMRERFHQVVPSWDRRSWNLYDDL